MQINGQNYSELEESGEKSIHNFPKSFVRHGKVQALASDLFA